jgi:hypothetical protein
MNTPNGAADLLQDDQPQRPLQLPKVGWDDDDDDDEAVLDPPEAAVPPSKSHKSNNNNVVTLRSVPRSELELLPIPEDMSMHGPWPEFCLYDYDYDRKKAYRYRMCGRFDCKSGLLTITCFVLLLVVVLRIGGPNPSSQENVQSKNKLTKEQAALYESVATSFQPLWYDRSRGWNGTAYLQSYEFCGGVVEGIQRVPCPYVAYCPLGAGFAPIGGVKEGDQWAPVLAHENAWVQVGKSNTCELYSAFHDSGPRWGLTGENNQEITQNIMCCLKAKNFQLPELPKTQVDESLNSDWMHRPPSLEEDEQYKEDKTSTNQDKQSIQQYSSSSSHNNNNNSPSQQYSSKDPLLNQISQADLQELIIFFEPIWFSRAYGWTGIDLAKAREFCQTKAGKRDVCPYIAYCPSGLAGPAKFEGYSPERDVEWAPMKELGEKHWVGVGKRNACEMVSDVGQFNLEDWEKVEDVAGNIMCCKDKPELDGDR